MPQVTGFDPSSGTVDITHDDGSIQPNVPASALPPGALQAQAVNLASQKTQAGIDARAQAASPGADPNLGQPVPQSMAGMNPELTAPPVAVDQAAPKVAADTAKQDFGAPLGQPQPAAPVGPTPMQQMDALHTGGGPTGVGAVQSATNAAMKDAGTIGAAQAAKGAEDVNTSQAIQNSITDQAKLEQDQAAAKQKFIDDDYKRRQDAQDQIDKMGVDPNRLWKNMNTGQKIGSIFAQLLGGAASGMKGQNGHNMATEAIDKATEQDIEQQTNAIKNAKSNLADRNGLVDYYYKATGDIDTAKLQAKQTYQKALAQQFTTAAARETNASAKAAADQKAQEYQVKAQQTESELRSQASSRALQGAETIKAKAEAVHAMNSLKPAAAQQGAGGLDEQQFLSLPQAQRDAMHPVKVDGRYYSATTSKGAEELPDKIAAVNVATNTLDAIQDLRKTSGPSVLPNVPRAKAQALAAQMIPMINEAVGLKRLSEEDANIMREGVAKDPLSIFSPFFMARSDALRKTLQDRKDAMLSGGLVGYSGASSVPTSPRP